MVVGESRPSTSQAPGNQDTLGLDSEDLYVKYKASIHVMLESYIGYVLNTNEFNVFSVN